MIESVVRAARANGFLGSGRREEGSLIGDLICLRGALVGIGRREGMKSLLKLPVARECQNRATTGMICALNATSGSELRQQASEIGANSRFPFAS